MTAFTDLLQNPHARRIYLTEWKIYHRENETYEYLRLSDKAYITKPTDTPANQFYEPRIVKGIVYTRSLWNRNGDINSKSKSSYGEMEIANDDGGLDYILERDIYSIVGFPVTALLGSDGFDYSAFGTVVNAVVSDVKPLGREKMLVTLTDAKRLFQRAPVNQNKYEGNNSSDEDIKGDITKQAKPKPQAWGQLKNVPLELVNESSGIWQVHDGEIEEWTTVYDGGLAGTEGLDWSSLPGGYIQWVGNPEKALTADIKGGLIGGVYKDDAPSIIKHMLTGSSLGGTVSGITIDDPSFSALTSSLSASSLTGTTGFYIRADDTIRESMNNLKASADILDSIDDMVDSILRGFYGFYFVNNEGKVQIGKLESPTTSYDLELNRENIVSLKVLKRIDPLWKVEVTYAKNYLVQEEGDLVGEVVENDIPRKNLLAEPYLLTSIENTGIRDEFPMAGATRIETYFANKIDADNVATQSLNIHGQPRVAIEVTAKSQGFGVDLNGIVKLVYDRHNLPAYYRVLKITQNHRKSEVSFILWG